MGIHVLGRGSCPLLMQVPNESLWRGYNLPAVGRTAGPWGREIPNLISLLLADSLQEGQPDSQWAMDMCQVMGRGPQASVRAYHRSPSNYPVLRTTEERINVDISAPLVALLFSCFLNKGPALSFCIEPCKLCSYSCSSDRGGSQTLIKPLRTCCWQVCFQVMAHQVVHGPLSCLNPDSSHSLKCLLTYTWHKIYSGITCKWRLMEVSIWQGGKRNKTAFKQ